MGSRNSTQHIKEEKKPLIAKKVSELTPGDLIRFERLCGLYSHWAVYVGKEEVIHLAAVNGPCGSSDAGVASSSSGKLNSKAIVRKDRFIDAKGSSKAYVHNRYDFIFNVKKEKDIIITAYKELRKGKEENYNVIFSNCEHFANRCRYGKKKSRQVSKLRKKGLILLIASCKSLLPVNQRQPAEAPSKPKMEKKRIA